MRELLLVALRHNILSGWLWILVGISKTCWKQNDADDLDSLRSFQGTYSIHSYLPVDQSNYDALSAGKARLSAYMQPMSDTTGLVYDVAEIGSADFGTALLHDSITHYARAAHNVLANGGSIRDGTAMSAEIIATTSTGMSGEISLTAAGDRKGGTRLNMVTVDETTQALKTEPIAEYQGSTDLFTMLVADGTLIWTGGTTTVPNDFSQRCEAGYYTLPKLKCMLCPVGKFAKGSKFDRYNCTSCMEDTYAPDAGQSACYPCQDVSATSGVGAQACNLCRPGFFLQQQNAQNTNSPASSTCTRCPPGKHQDKVGQMMCMNCTSGRAASEGLQGGDAQCPPCKAGMYSEEGAQSCARCPVGEYSAVGGASQCTTCPNARTTTYKGAAEADDCVCPEGSYESLSDGCTPCPEKMTCAAGGREANFGTDKTQPMLDPGFWSSEAEPLSVFACIKVQDCPGGYPGSCNGGLIGRACAHCPDAMTLTGERICDDCRKGSGARIALIVTIVIFVMLGLAFLHMFVNLAPVHLARRNMNCVFLCGMAMTQVFIINIYANLGSVWAAPLSTFFELVGIFEFDLKSVSFSCILGTEAPVANYAFKLLGVPLAFICLVTGLLILHFVPSLRPYTSIHRVAFVNSTGLLMMTFFIAVCSNSVEGFNCSQNPNGKLTLSTDRSILCWEGDEHVGFVVLGVFALLLNPVLFLAATGLVTLNYNRWSIKSGPSFIMSVRFLVNRMNPEVFYFGFWFNFRNFLLTLVPVVTVNIALQVFGLMLIFVIWLLLMMHFLPWRFPILNFVDAFVSSMNIMLLTCFAMLAGLNSKISSETAGWAVIVSFLLTIVPLLGTGAYKVLSRFRSSKEFVLFICHPKTGAGLFARQIKMMTQWHTTGKVFFDVDELENLDNLNFTVRGNTVNFLILVTMETFNRLWCAVEVVSASMNQVPILLARVSELTEDPLGEGFFSKLDKVWSPLELAEFNKLGFNLAEVERSYRHVATLPSFSLPFSGTFEAQNDSIKSILDVLVDCPRKEKVVAAEMGQEACIVYDTKDATQMCVARVMHLLLKGARWSSHLCSQGGQEPLSATAWKAAVVFISKNLIKDPVNVGTITVMHMQGVPLVTALSQEDFPGLDKDWVTKLRRGTGLSKDGAAIVQTMAPGSTMNDIADAQEALFKILAWRFNPQESEMLMNVEFQRVVERLKTSSMRKIAKSKPPLVSQVGTAQAVALDIQMRPTHSAGSTLWVDSKSKEPAAFANGEEGSAADRNGTPTPNSTDAEVAGVDNVEIEIVRSFSEHSL